MERAAAERLALSLRRTAAYGAVRLYARVVVGFLQAPRIVFSGGPRGEHSLDVAASSRARVLAHWEGYCENAGLALPPPGAVVAFVGRNGLTYRGRVLSVGPLRVRVSAPYRRGGRFERSVPQGDLRIERSAP